MADAIRSSPALRWAALENKPVSLALTLGAGRVLADYGTFTLHIREDPEWPRSGESLADILSPEADAWDAVVTATHTLVSGVPTFNITVPAGVGKRRYVVGIVSGGGTAGRVSIFDATWLEVFPGGG